jgi:hypothetical protein
MLETALQAGIVVDVDLSVRKVVVVLVEVEAVLPVLQILPMVRGVVLGEEVVAGAALAHA